MSTNDFLSNLNGELRQVTMPLKVLDNSGNVLFQIDSLGNLTFAAGNPGTPVGPVIDLSSNVTPVSTATGTSAQTLMSFALPAGILSKNAQGIYIFASGTTAANANSKTVELDFGATQLVSSGSLAANNKPWFLEAYVFRTGATAQLAVGQGQANAAIVAQNNSTPAETLANSITVAMKATDATSSAGDVTCNQLLIQLLS